MTFPRNGQPPKCSPPNPPDKLGDELRSWVDRVIVPILVQELLQEKHLKGDMSDG